MNVPDLAVQLSEALPTLPVMDAVRMAASLRAAGLTLCAADMSGGWCSRCRVLFGSSDATMCMFCGYDLDPVSFSLETVAAEGGEHMGTMKTEPIEQDDEVQPDDEGE